MGRIAEGLRSVAGAAALLVAVLLIPRPALAQSAPCVYTDTRGDLVITAGVADPNCPAPAADPRRDSRVAAAAPAPTPGRLRVTMAVAEVIALAHQIAVRNGVDHRLVESLVEMESGFDTRAVSRRGAMGLMQLMPDVARELGVTDPFDPWQNLDGGVRHLRSLLEHFDADLERSLAAYNAGTGAVERYDGVPPYRETRDYVRRVLARYRQRVAGMPLH